MTSGPDASAQPLARRSAVLHGRRSEKIDVAAALGSSGFASGVALLSSANAYRVARWDGRRLLVPAVGGETEATLAPSGRDAVFEMRMFDGTAELRWVNRTGGFGRAVVLSEQPDRVDGTLAKPLPPLVAVHSIDTSYLLWGTPASSGSGPGSGSGTGPGSGAGAGSSLPAAWTRLLEARIGRLDVPFPHSDVPPGGRMLLDTIEYVATDDYGNAYVAEERLVGLRAVSAQAALA